MIHIYIYVNIDYIIYTYCKNVTSKVYKQTKFNMFNARHTRYALHTFYKYTKTKC